MLPRHVYMPPSISLVASIIPEHEATLPATIAVFHLGVFHLGVFHLWCILCACLH